MKRTQQERIQQGRPGQLSSIPINREEEIRRRAYELYQERGESSGSSLEDWLQAEAEVLDNQHTQRAA
jgi:hypothetical protein